ncbi:MAG: endoribonuclease L-PSP, putative [Haloquadratum sp. J07HQX50]|jgi:endoribonuclease L-PSP|nr:MAG: endoribonuclease L-PSP, putative [Haloquadratum sp. J07HQX50]
MKEVVDTTDAPAAVGAYSQATMTDDLLLTAGQLPLTTEGELLDKAPVGQQTRQCLENIEAILDSAGLEIESLIKVNVFLNDMADFDDFNDAYAEFFSKAPPARSAIEVAAVPKGAAIEIEAIATRSP